MFVPRQACFTMGQLESYARARALIVAQAPLLHTRKRTVAIEFNMMGNLNAMMIRITQEYIGTIHTAGVLLHVAFAPHCHAMGAAPTCEQARRVRGHVLEAAKQILRSGACFIFSVTWF